MLEIKISKHLYLFLVLLVAYFLMYRLLLPMNTNIVILVSQLFYILPKFQEEIKHLMIILQRLCKKKIIPSTTPIKDNKDRPYAKDENFNQNLVHTNHTLSQTLK